MTKRVPRPAKEVKAQFEALKIVNDWEYLTYFHRGKQLDETKGGVARILWPDGSSQTVKFRAETQRVTYQDMGHTNDCNRFVWRFSVEHCGHVVTLNLSEFLIGQIKQED